MAEFLDALIEKTPVCLIWRVFKLEAEMKVKDAKMALEVARKQIEKNNERKGNRE
jgi:hypothetical protein